ncbi:MAG: efflux RND transporter periplasmic adaptor subunit [Bacteroidota bacterium]|nr:efflux RND transporter periplasmic adaptor subunit [Bacteroidota bacterium]
MIIVVSFLIVSVIIFLIHKKRKNKHLKYLYQIFFGITFVLLIAFSTGIIENSEKIQVDIILAERNNIIELVSASGKVQPMIEVKISPDVSGEIVNLSISEGDQIKEGDLLLEIKRDIYLSILERTEATLNTAKANLLKSEAQLVEAESNYKRNKILYDIDAISTYEFEQIESSFTVSKLNVESAKYSVISANASLKEAQENLDKTSIFAPIEGTISKLNVELGERVVGTGQMAGTEILRLADLNAMEVVVEVNENDIVRVSKYDTAIIEVDAFLKQKFTGVVTEIANSADIVGVTADQVTNFQVKIAIVDTAAFLPGMTATVDIMTNKVKNVVSIPIQAVTTRMNLDNDNITTECVFLLDNKKAKKRPIETGLQDMKNIEIISGINEGDKVIIGPYSAVSEFLQNGTRVKQN